MWGLHFFLNFHRNIQVLSPASLTKIILILTDLVLFSLYSNAYFVWILLKLHFTNTFSVYSGAGCLPSLSACLLPGDCHLLIQTSRRFPQLDQYLPAACLSLLQGTNTTWSLLCAYIYVFYCFTWDMTCQFVCMCMQVIEVLVRSEQGLFREVVKHLNQVEEQVLESLAWTSNSPLWETLRGAKDQVPACKQVQNLQQTPQHLRTTQRIHKYSCVCACVCQVMPPQYLEQNNDSSSGSLPITPVNQGQNLNIGSALKGILY